MVTAINLIEKMAELKKLTPRMEYDGVKWHAYDFMQCLQALNTLINRGVSNEILLKLDFGCLCVEKVLKLI